MRVVDLKIEDIAFGGKGVGRERGKAVFVPYTIDCVIGFFRRDSHQLIDIEHCPISTDEVNRALTELRAQPYLRDGHYTLRASASPRVFLQTNDKVANALRDLVVHLVPPNQELLI